MWHVLQQAAALPRVRGRVLASRSASPAPPASDHHIAVLVRQRALPLDPVRLVVEVVLRRQLVLQISSAFWFGFIIIIIIFIIIH